MGCSGSKAAAAARPQSPASKPSIEKPKNEGGEEEAQNSVHDESVAVPDANGSSALAQPAAAQPEREVDLLEDVDPLEGIDLSIPEDCEEVAMKNGVTYRGEWRNGKQHGRGEQRQAQGVVYTGQFNQGQIDGFGRLTRSDGSKYEGEFVKGKAETRTRPGVYTFPDGSK